MSDNENKKSKELKEIVEELPANIKIMAVISTFFLTFSFLFSATNEAIDKSEFTVYTLSSEELKGDTYTSRTTFDDSDMWETEDVSTTLKETVITTIQTETIAEITTSVHFPLDINSATIEELVLIDGVGMVTAEKIVDYRNKYGYFYDYNELLYVDGIGDKKLANLMEYIYISDDLLNITTVNTEEIIVTTVPITETKISETVTVTAETTLTEVVTEEFEIVIEEFEYDDESEEDTFEDDEPEETTIITTKRYVNFPIELNTATAEDLMCIDGIGEYTAYKIIEYATAYGFYSVEELLNVDGIGNSKLSVISPYVYVDSSMLPPKTETTIFVTETFTFTEAVAETTIAKVNINTCSKAELMQLPGIDDNLASNIIEFRETVGGFIRIEELSVVDGMTNNTLSAIWNYIYV